VPFLPSPALGIAACGGFGLVAILGSVMRRPILIAVGKPAATLSLLLVVGLPPANAFGWLIACGILLSTVGDVFLLGDGDREFLLGTAVFLVAHVCYSAAFLTAAAWNRFPPMTFTVLALSVALVYLLWPRLGAMRLPVVIYAVAITVMVIAALAMQGGRLPRSTATIAAAGAFLFYLSDASLAWNRFRRPFPHAPLITLSLYWLGQIGIALATRWQG
jgi:alkenylglycerophosphocholine/alkenylglycerophosphoethanolamine hydrolase